MQILHHYFLTLLDSHVIDLIIEPNQKTDCRPNLRKKNGRPVSQIGLIYMLLLISCIWKSVPLCEVRGTGRGELKYEVKLLNSSFPSSNPTRIWWIRFCVPVNSSHPPACAGLKIRQITAFLTFHWIEFHTSNYAKSLIWLTLTTSNLTSNSSFYHVTPI